MKITNHILLLGVFAVQFFASASWGKTCLNPATLQAMRNGQLSPTRQFIAVNECMDNCVRTALQALPGYLDPYVTAIGKANQMRCILDACYQETTLLTILPMVQGAFDQEYAQKYLASVMTGLRNNQCGSQQLDPLWIQLLTGR